MKAMQPGEHLAAVQGYSSLVALPLLAKGQSIGVICIYFKEPRSLKDYEMNLLATAANEAAIAIENARIYDNLQDAFVGTIRSLAETIDAKDTYTRGHSERVSLYSEAIARGLGLKGKELQTIRYAGYLHDVGKIGIPDAILSKPGKLTVEEFRIIQKHPVISEKILSPVKFPFPVQSIVRHHHERFDGKGYPDSHAAEEIPLGARILFVADAYEAMTSDRPYRKALSTEMALGELERNKNTQFDPRIVEVFAGIIRSESSAQRGGPSGSMRMINEHFDFTQFLHISWLRPEARRAKKRKYFVAGLEMFNLVVAMIAFYFALRILPSISRDVRKRSWLFLSLAAICFGIAEIIGVL